VPRFGSAAEHHRRGIVQHANARNRRALYGASDMFAIIALVLLVLWAAGFLAFHVAGGLIHLLLVIALIMLVLHFVRGRSSTV